MIFELARDFAGALEVLPQDHPRHRILRLLEEAIRRDIHFIDHHPTTLFQCMWNTCWSCDCPQAGRHYRGWLGWQLTWDPLGALCVGLTSDSL